MNNIGSRLFAFFIWPFGAWLSALRKANQKSSYVVFFLFSLLLCWHMSPTEGTYYDDFVGILDRFKNTYFTTNDIVDQIRLFITRSDDAPKELYENVLTWYIKSYTDNYHFFFLLASIPIALCQLKSLSFITFDERYDNSIMAILAMILFIVPRDIITTQNPRFATGFWFCVLGTLLYYCSKKRRLSGIILVLLAPFCHSGLWFFVILFAAGYLLTLKTSLTTKVIETLALVSIPFAYFDAGFLGNINISFLPDSLQRWAAIYMDEEYYNHYILNVGRAGFWWVGSTFEFIMRTTYLYMTWMIIKHKEYTSSDEQSSKLYPFYLLIFAMVNMLQFVPVLGARYYWFMRVFCIFMWFKAFWGSPYYKKAIQFLFIGCFYEMFRRYGYILDGALSVNTPLDMWFTPLPYLIGKGLWW